MGRPWKITGNSEGIPSPPGNTAVTDEKISGSCTWLSDSQGGGPPELSLRGIKQAQTGPVRVLLTAANALFQEKQITEELLSGSIQRNCRHRAISYFCLDFHEALYTFEVTSSVDPKTNRTERDDPFRIAGIKIPSQGPRKCLTQEFLGEISCATLSRSQVSP
ncbi:hypothetical protein [Sutterella sp.]|uniref:hypothetical protein n=1 Tax=Sutterella sp. TaxID=1981025 RepID=UPI0026DEB8F3|nr:hypothetical protein [Sutterella sp.]MDO5532712.1 hypothetical protein [Sutterella sp.]